MTNQIAKFTKHRQETRLEHKHLISLLIGLQEGFAPQLSELALLSERKAWRPNLAF
jgi:hypothetical protein